MLVNHNSEIEYDNKEFQATWEKFIAPYQFDNKYPSKTELRSRIERDENPSKVLWFKLPVHAAPYRKRKYEGVTDLLPHISSHGSIDTVQVKNDSIYIPLNDHYMLPMKLLKLKEITNQLNERIDAGVCLVDGKNLITSTK